MAAGRRDQRGVVLPSPVMMLSVLAVELAAVAFVATRGPQQGERELTQVYQPNASVTSPPTTPSATAKPTPTRAPKPVVRKKVLVEVFNNTSTKGLAATASQKASTVGWQVVGTDNWYGSVPATTVYYPQRLEAAAKVLAHDLGVHRMVPAVDPMRLDRLTVILTGELA